MKYKVFESSDTNVKKFVFEFDEPKAIAETVLYRYGDYRKRTVICCSVQSGCNVGCAFCGTGKSDYKVLRGLFYCPLGMLVFQAFQLLIGWHPVGTPLLAAVPQLVMLL